MALNLDAIRKVFPDWPSELDVAKCESNWASMAQNFYSAASVLQEEMSVVRQRMHFSKPMQLTEDILMRMNVSQPALFCMAFALELAAKAATIRRCQGKGIEHAKRLPFAGHCLTELCHQLPELALSAADMKLMGLAEHIVVSGKYPSDIKPRDDRPFPDAPQLRVFMEGAVPIYLKLMHLSSEAHPVVAGDAGHKGLSDD